MNVQDVIWYSRRTRNRTQADLSFHYIPKSLQYDTIASNSLCPTSPSSSSYRRALHKVTFANRSVVKEPTSNFPPLKRKAKELTTSQAWDVRCGHVEPPGEYLHSTRPKPT